MLISHSITQSTEFLNQKFSDNMKQIHKIMDNFNNIQKYERCTPNKVFIPTSYPNRKDANLFDQSTLTQTQQILNKYAQEDEEFLKNSRNLSDNCSATSRVTKLRHYQNNDFPKVSSRTLNVTSESQNKQNVTQQKRPYSKQQDDTLNKTYQQFEDYLKIIQTTPTQNILQLNIDAANKKQQSSSKEQTLLLPQKGILTENTTMDKLMSCAPSNKELLQKQHPESTISRNLLNTFNETQHTQQTIKIHSRENNLSLDQSIKQVQLNSKKNKSLILNVTQIKRTVRTQLETKPQDEDAWYKKARKTDKNLSQQKSGKKIKIQCDQCDEFLQMGLSTTNCVCRKKH